MLRFRFESAQQYIDQAIFDCGVLVLGIFGTLELEEKKTKFEINEFIKFNGLLDTYQNIRPNDQLYKTQTADALEWLLYSIPISVEADQFSELCRKANDIRMELNAEMQPPSLKERVFRGAMFQPESKNYLNRTEQAKINISTILQQVSPEHLHAYRNLENLERKLSSNTLSYFISNVKNKLKAALHKDASPMMWQTEVHFISCISACCYWSALKRFQNFPTFKTSVTPKILATELSGAMMKSIDGRISSEFSAKLLDYYINNIFSTSAGIKNEKEIEIWETLYTELTFSKYVFDQDIEYFLNECAEQVDSYSVADVYNVDIRGIGIDYLNR